MAEEEKKPPPTVIDKKIVGFKVLTDEPEEVEGLICEQTGMHEEIERDEILNGRTYKFKHPVKDFAYYVTLNDKEINGNLYPYEIFINCKDPESAQWVFALTRVISAVFRKGGDVVFLADELKSVFDPAGGYFKKGGVFMPSIIAEVGHILEKHLIAIGIIEVQKDKATEEFIAQKREEYKKANPDDNNTAEYPPQSTVCPKCSVKAVILMDGCQTCLSCGESHCN